MIQLFLTTIILVIGSAFCSASEAAIFSVSTSKLESGAQYSQKYKTLLEVKQNITSTIGSIVILNNIFNIAGTAFVGSLAFEVLQNEVHFVLFSAVLTVLIIIFGEIIPKNIGERYALNFGLIVAPILVMIRTAFLPILWNIETFNRTFFGERTVPAVSEDEIKILINQGVETQHIEPDEKLLIQNVFTLNDKTARDIMTPRVNIHGLELHTPIKDQIDDVSSSQFSRFPVYNKDYDNIIGYVLARDILTAAASGNGDATPESFMHNILSVKETTRVDSLLIIFQKKRQHMILVVDEFGGTAGLVTLEDVLEQLVGEIVDETDEIIDMREVVLAKS